MSTLKQVLRQDFTSYVRPHFEKSECEVCGSEIEHLHVHHVTHFQDLLNETLEQLHLKYYEDTDCYTDEQLQLIRELMIGKQMRIKYITCCQLCHLELHKRVFNTNTNTKRNICEERLGMEFTTTQGHIIKVVEYCGNQKVCIEFQDEYKARRWTTWQAITSGSITNPGYIERKNIEFHDKVVKSLQVGQIVHNYIDMCKILDEDYRSGQSKISQLKRWARHFSWEYPISKKTKKPSKQFLITEIYDTPKQQ